MRVDRSSATSLVPKRKRKKVNFGELRFTRNWVEATPSGVHPPCLSASAREYINSILLIRSGGNEMHDDLIQLGGEIGTKIHYGFLVVSVLLVLIVWELSKIRKKL